MNVQLWSYKKCLHFKLTEFLSMFLTKNGLLYRFCSTGLDHIYSISTAGHSFSSDFQEKSTFPKSSGWFVGHLLCFPFDFSLQLFSAFSVLPPPCALFPSLVSGGHYTIVPACFSAIESMYFQQPSLLSSTQRQVIMVVGGHHRQTGSSHFLMAAQPSCPEPWDGWQKDLPDTHPVKPSANTKTSFQLNQTMCFI